MLIQIVQCLKCDQKYVVTDLCPKCQGDAQVKDDELVDIITKELYPLYETNEKKSCLACSIAHIQGKKIFAKLLPIFTHALKEKQEAVKLAYQRGLKEGIEQGEKVALSMEPIWKEQARKEERRKLADQLMFDDEDVTVFDTSYGYNQVKISPVFLNEDSDLWQTIKEYRIADAPALTQTKKGKFETDNDD